MPSALYFLSHARAKLELHCIYQRLHLQPARSNLVLSMRELRFSETETVEGEIRLQSEMQTCFDDKILPSLFYQEIKLIDITKGGLPFTCQFEFMLKETCFQWRSPASTTMFELHIL